MFITISAFALSRRLEGKAFTKTPLLVKVLKPNGEVMPEISVGDPEITTVEDFLNRHLKNPDPMTFLDLITLEGIQLKGSNLLSEVAKGMPEIFLTVLAHKLPAKVIGAEIIQDLEEGAPYIPDSFDEAQFYYPVRLVGKRAAVGYIGADELERLGNEGPIGKTWLKRSIMQFIRHGLCRQDFKSVMALLPESWVEILVEELTSFYFEGLSFVEEVLPTAENPIPIWIKSDLPQFLKISLYVGPCGVNFLDVRQVGSLEKTEEAEFEVLRRFGGPGTVSTVSDHVIERTGTKVKFMKKIR